MKNLSNCYVYIKEFEKAENCIKEIINIKPDEPFAYQFLASILKDQDKIEEATLIVNQGLEKGLINEKWEVQKNLFFPKIPSDNDDIIKYRRTIEDEVEKILDVNFEKKLDYDNDQIIVPPHVDLSYSNLDNLELNKKSVQAFKKLFRILNEESYSKIELKDKIKIGIVSEFFTDHTIGKKILSLVLTKISLKLSFSTLKKRVLEKYSMNLKRKKKRVS